MAFANKVGEHTMTNIADIQYRYALLAAAWQELAYDRPIPDLAKLLPAILTVVPEAFAWDVADALRWYAENLKQQSDRIERFLGEQEHVRCAAFLQGVVNNEPATERL
jgi:hypothetical protein